MKPLKKSYLLVTITITSVALIADQAQYEKIANPKTTPENVFQTLEGLKIRTFAVDSFIKNKVDPQELETWTSFVFDANKYVFEMIKSDRAPKQYLQAITQLDTILNFIKKTTTTLFKEKENLSTEETDSLLVLAQKYLIEARAINQMALNTINNQNPYPESWTKKVPEAFETISIKLDMTPSTKIPYGKFFETLNAEEINTLKPQEFRTLLTAKHIVSKYTIIELLNSLEQLNYRFDQVKDNLWFKTPHFQNQFKLARVLSEKIKDSYPEALSQLQLARFAVNTDKVSIIIFGQSGAYMSVLGKIINDLWKILGI